MFRFVCTILTTTAMLAHNLLGCGICHAGCRHSHDHVAAGPCAEQEQSQHEQRNNSNEAPTWQGSSGCDHEHLVHESDDAPCSASSEEPSPLHPDKSCTATGCSYVGATDVKLPVIEVTNELLPCDLLAITTPAHLECIAQASDCYRGGYPPALRAQIWLSAWLV